MSPSVSRLILWFALAAAALGASADRTSFDHSILAVPAAADTAHPRRGRIVRTALQTGELAAPTHFEIVLRMPNFAELSARLAHSEQISRTEMAARYFPAAGDESRLVAWAQAAGLTIDRTDDNHLAIFGHGSVTAVAAAFQTTFARVANPDGEFTSAIAAPSLPSDLAPAVLGIHGLQPHLRAHRLSQRQPTSLTPDATFSGYTPAQILTAYKAASLGLTGNGQTIAVLENAYPANSDLTAFWSKAGVTAASVNNITQINIENGPGSDPSSDALTEACLDVEWLTGLAPGAKIRIYGSNENSNADFDLTFQQIYADVASNRTMQVLSCSFGGYELEIDQDYLVIEAQYMANLAAAGVTVFASSGDNGSLGSENELTVDYPASDPNVTGVGGTTLLLDSGNNISSETAWSDSGGGTSVIYARPSWQTGAGIASGNFRLVPDVAAAGNANYGALIVEDGQAQVIGGTSWACPIWAAFAALIDQSRSSAGSSSLGALNPRIYALNETAAFHDITSGSNQTYSAGPGYDEVTGLGSPQLASLIVSNLSGADPLTIVAQLPAAFSTIGQPATFYTVASGTGPFTYQWQRQPAGTSGWTNLSNNGTFSGTTTAMLVIASTTYAMNGDSYQCVVSNSSTSVTGKPIGLTVSPVGVTTIAGWPDSAGRVNGTGWAARFDFIGAVASDSNGNVYVADGGGNTVREVTAAGVVTTLAGQPGTAGWADGTGTAALFNSPSGIVLDGLGNLYVADAGDYTIRKVVIQTGQVTTFAGAGNSPGLVNGTGTAAKFEGPSALAIDSNGNLYVADGNAIRKITTPGAVVTTLAGSTAAGSSNGTGTAASFNDPQGVAVDSNNNVWVGDTGNNTIRFITVSNSAVTTFAGLAGRSGTANGTETAARFDGPAGLRVDSSFNVYVCDSANCTIREISPSAVVTTIAGTTLDPDDVDGVGTAAAFNYPGDLTLGPGGIIYVGDSSNYTIRRFVPGSVAAPSFTSQPVSVTVAQGSAASFSVAVSTSSSPPLTYQWLVEATGTSTWVDLTDGGVYSGSATATLTISAASVALAGNQYECVVANPVGSATSSAATLTVTGAPTLNVTSQAIAVGAGDAITLSASASGSNLSYQWTLNGTAIAGATASTYTIASFSSANAGVYAVTVTNPYGSATATVATLTVGTTRLLNLSARSTISGGSLLTAGFVIGGTGQETVLLRGIGPALTAFSVSGALPDPELTLLNSGGTQLAQNTAWGDTSALSAAFSATGAFALSASSHDDALLLTLASVSQYTSQVASVSGGTGAVLNEIYEDDSGTPAARLLNLSALGTVSSGSQLVGGFVIGAGSLGSGAAGNTEEVLIRGVGPSLADFGVTGFLANPVLTVYNAGSAVIATNSGWTNNSATTTAQFTALFSAVGAFALNSGSSDAAVFLTLAPGNYTAQVTGAGNTSGQALIEIYEVTP